MSANPSCPIDSTGISPSFEIIPNTAPSGDLYSITTRPTSITGGNYGIVGDNGQITKVENNSTIVNETNNTSWTYDYSDRSYHLTLQSGDTVTVTYGDEYITIQEGDTVYNVYYIIESSGDTHTHDWRESGVTDPTCTQAGKKTYTCSTCGDTKQETTSALGHDWLVEYDLLTESVFGGKRFEVYYCHSYSAWEKGTNENHNRLANFFLLYASSQFHAIDPADDAADLVSAGDTAVPFYDNVQYFIRCQWLAGVIVVVIVQGFDFCRE